MMSSPRLRVCLATLAASALCAPLHAAQHITLRNGSEFDCIRQERAGDRIRLYLYPATRAASDINNYVEVSADSVVRVETVPDPPPPPAPVAARPGAPHLDSEMWVRDHANAPLTAAEMRQLLARAGAVHNIDVDLLASVIKAESDGNARAVSRAGAQGLMQLMPATASDLGVHNSFAPDQNITGGTTYLDQLLTRYRDNLALALAAYNAGPAAVDRYHGIPPYRETRTYVARVIREFNRRKLAGISTQSASNQ